eukprot:scaffold17863_cov101-Isochrysis_galbana.AAC.1
MWQPIQHSRAPRQKRLEFDRPEVVEDTLSRFVVAHHRLHLRALRACRYAEVLRNRGSASAI